VTAFERGFIEGEAVLRRVGDQISVSEFLGPRINCHGSPTVTNTDRVKIIAKGPLASVDINLSGGSFAPGATPDPGSSSEIEFTIGEDGFVFLHGGSEADHFRYMTAKGQSGLNLNAGPEDEDADVLVQDPEVNLIVEGGQGPDTIDVLGRPRVDVDAEGNQGNDSLIARHGDGVLGGVILDGGSGGDRIIGGPLADDITPGYGPDVVKARGGADRMVMWPDKVRDRIGCGPGQDRVYRELSSGPPADPFDRLRSCERVKRRHGSRGPVEQIETSESPPAYNARGGAPPAVRSGPRLGASGRPASVKCRYDAATHVLSVTSHKVAELTRAGDTIEVLDVSRSPVNCQGSPMVTNTDHINLTAKPFCFFYVDLSQGAFAPGATPEADASPEIEFTLRGDGEFGLGGGPGPDHFRYMTEGGKSGVNLNVGPEDEDADLIVPDPSTELFLDGQAGSDTIEVAGHVAVEVYAQGGGGNDTLIGRRGGDGAILSGGNGNDRIIGTPVFDLINPGPGADVVKAKGGDDEIDVKPDKSRDQIDCDGGNDAVVKPDPFDHLRSCEHVLGRR
jgi:hypothetical protein